MIGEPQVSTEDKAQQGLCGIIDLLTLVNPGSASPFGESARFSRGLSAIHAHRAGMVCCKRQLREMQGVPHAR